jgi:toxin-antitoxin system PIN domain toxin
VTIIDTNILFYAYDEGARQHDRAAEWLNGLLSSAEQIWLPWITLWGFIRLSTNARILSAPMETEEVFSIVREWMSQPSVIVPQPGPRHAAILERLVVGTGARAGMVTDAALAALAIENGATLASADHDFSRFPDLKWVNPLA